MHAEIYHSNLVMKYVVNEVPTDKLIDRLEDIKRCEILYPCLIPSLISP